MNELQRYFPNNQLQTLMDDLISINTWDDFARKFLLGEGNSPNTTATYLAGCKQFYDFTDGLHPMQAGTPEWIESFYDSLLARVDLNTAVLRIRALKFMYKKICERFPFYTSPFHIMSESLKRKLKRTKQDDSERDSLTDQEYKDLLKYLRRDKSLKGLQDYAIIRFGVTSGMRAAELVALEWSNIEKTEAGYNATFTGKGNKVRTIQLEVEAVQVIRRAHKAKYGSMPTFSGPVFHSLTTDRMGKSGVHVRVKAIAEAGKAAGILRQNLLVSTHVLRHTCATRLLDSGIDIYTVSRHLGHSNVSTTDRYLHNRADLTAAFERMSA